MSETMPQKDWSDFAEGGADKNGWRPIESAPKNEAVLLAYILRGRKRCVQSARLTEAIGEGIWSWCVDDDKFGPYPIRGYQTYGLLGWQPLPAPPEHTE